MRDDPSPTLASPAVAEEQTDDRPPRRRRVSLRTVDSFRDPNFRWFFASMFGGFTAISLQAFVGGWLIFELTESFRWAGLMALAQGIASLGLSLIGGVLSDRLRQKKHLVQLGQGFSVFVGLAMGLLIAADRLEVVHILIAAALFGGSHALTMPARQSLTPQVVGMERLTNAMALYTSGQNAAFLLMPGLGGVIVASFGSAGSIDGAQWVYYVISALYVASLLLLARVRAAPREATPGARSARTELLEGARYIMRTPVIRMLLAYNIVVALFLMTFMVLLPGFVKDVLNEDVRELGILQSLAGGGAVAGSLVVASLSSRRRGLLLLLSSMLLGFALLGFALSTSYVLSVPIVIVIGIGQAGYLSISNVLLQAYVDEEYRGRVLSVYLMQFGLMALGTFGISVAASFVGPQWAVGVSALILLGVTAPLLATGGGLRQLD